MFILDLGSKLKELRTLKGVNQSELAKILNVDRSTYGKYETGDSSPDYEKLLKLASYFNVSTDYLLSNKTSDSEKNSTFGNAEEINAEYLPPDFKELIANAKNLSPEQLKQLNNFLKTLK